jgi:hypothetical protein
MKFSPTDIADILDATGEDIEVYQLGVPTGQIIRAKFRKDFEAASPFEATGGLLQPSFLCDNSALAEISGTNTFMIGGVEYRLHTKPQQLDSGFTRVTVAVKK